MSGKNQPPKSAAAAIVPSGNVSASVCESITPLSDIGKMADHKNAHRNIAAQP